VNTTFRQRTRSYGPRGARISDVVNLDRHRPPEARAEVVPLSSADERAAPPGLGKVAEAAPLVRCLPSTPDNRLVDIGGIDEQGHGGKGGADGVLPDEHEAVRLLPGGATNAPCLEGASAFSRPRHELRQDTSLEELEDRPVSIEAGDRDVAERVEMLPFIRRRLQVRAVAGHSGKVELAEAPLDSPADLPADLPEARPAHLHAR
jgi:hypothetical protein